MMEQLKNSAFSTVLQVLLIGYFLISSLNLSNNLNRIATQNADVHNKESVVWNIFKKMLKCNTNAEEYEDCDNEPANNSNNKIKLIVDYILPGQAGIIICGNCRIFLEKNYSEQPNINGILYNKIHLPPPEITL